MIVLTLALSLLGIGAMQYIRIVRQSGGKNIGQSEHMLGAFCIAGFGAMLVIGVKQHLWLGCVLGVLAVVVAGSVPALKKAQVSHLHLSAVLAVAPVALLVQLALL